MEPTNNNQQPAQSGGQAAGGRPPRRPNNNNPRPAGNNQGPRNPQGRGGNNRNRGNDNQSSNASTSGAPRGISRGQAVRAQKRSQMDAQRIANQFAAAVIPQGEQRRANVIDDSPRLKIIGLGGMDGGGSKNMILVEYINDAIILDCGNDLGVDLPGINYGIADTAYLESIKHKLRAYVITHGHLDHI